MFKAGDRVKFMESSLASGMIDAKEDDVFTVHESYKRAVTLKELQGCYHVTHFEHVKEEIVDNTEEQEIKWEVGQEVWDVRLGRGKVVKVVHSNYYPVSVRLVSGKLAEYTLHGQYNEGECRSLFFSEPKIEAEKFPPKKPFTPTLKKGDVVLVVTNLGEKAQVVEKETEDRLITVLTDYKKSEILQVHRIGEEITFD